MTFDKTNGHSMAVALLKHAARISPPARKEWVHAMHNELEDLPCGSAAVSWALGCALVSYRERVVVMIGSLNNVARWLLSVEMAVCLVPLTWLFIAIFAMTTHGVMRPELAILAGSAALLGPIGLLIGLRVILVSSSSLSRTTTTVMALLAAWTVVAYCLQVIQDGARFSDGWRDFALLVVLPTWAVLHVLQINASRRITTAIA
ncbi:MAG: hypothetical protein ACREVO_15105 [Steroidobacteraceae bacterium]